MCSLQCSLHEVNKGEQTRVVVDSQVTQQRRLHERTVSSSDTIWSLATIREATMYIYFFDFEVRVASRARHTASHELQFAGPFG